MHGENGTAIDLGDVARVIDAAEVAVRGFPFCAERLLLDLRPDGLSGPLIQLVEPVDSASERTTSRSTSMAVRALVSSEWSFFLAEPSACRWE